LSFVSNNLSAHNKEIVKKHSSTIVYGKVEWKDQDEFIILDTTSMATIQLQKATFETVSIRNGNHRQDISRFIATIANPTLSFGLLGFDYQEIAFAN